MSQKYNEKRYYISGFLQYVLSLADMKPKGKVDTLRGGTHLLKEVIILFKSKPVGGRGNQIDKKQIYTTGYTEYIKKKKIKINIAYSKQPLSTNIIAWH